MVARRNLALLLVGCWLSPAALAGATALHVALDHHPGASAVLGALAGLVEHGHAHAGETAHHDHELVPAPDLAARRDSTSSASVVPVESAIARDAPALVALADHPPLSPPPRASGPALLALLSTLRV